MLPLLPLLLSLVLILLTRRIALSLTGGFLLGALLHKWRAWEELPLYLWETFQAALLNPWHYSALIFTALLGGFAAMLREGGGLARLFQDVDTRRGLELRTIGLGVLCFFDGLASGVIIARVVRPVADRLGLAREKVAYLADTTSSAIACIAPISTWIAMQLGLIGAVLAERDLAVSPYGLFLSSIPLNFYCLLSLILALILALTGRDYGPMRHAKRSASQTSERLVDPVPLGVPLVAIGTLLVGIPLLYYLLGTESILPLSFTKLADALGSNAGPTVFITMGIISIITLLLLPPYGRNRLANKATAAAKGIGTMVLPLLVLLSAWLFGGVIKDLGLAAQLSALLGEAPPLRWLPALVFGVGCLLSFCTGTSWGTMALLFPLAFGALSGLEDAALIEAMPLLIAAIFSGSVFGDHCSPYSDTTIVSAAAAGCTPYQHVRTQLPYALTAGAGALLLFLLLG